MASSPFEDFVNTELPKRIATNDHPLSPVAGNIPVFTGVGLLTENKAPSELGLVTPSELTTAINTALSSVYKFQTIYDPSITSQYPTSTDTVGSVPIKKGFLWIISGIVGQQTIGTKTVNNGDSIMALIDNAGVAVDTDWHITEANLGYTPENDNNKVQDLSTASAIAYPSVDAVLAGLGAKQNTLVSGTNIKTVNGNTLLGSGNLVVEAGTTVIANNTTLVTAAASTNYLVQSVASHSVDAAALSDGYVMQIVNASASDVTITFSGAGTYLSYGGASVPSVVLNRGAALRLVKASSVVRVYLASQAKHTDWKLYKTTGSSTGVTIDASAITVDRAITMPDKAVNLGDLPSVATTNSNSNTGTRSTITGGQFNNVSGTDNSVTNSSYNTVSGTGNTIIGGGGSGAGNSVSGTRCTLVNCKGVNTSGIVDVSYINVDLIGNTYTNLKFPDRSKVEGRASGSTVITASCALQASIATSGVQVTAVVSGGTVTKPLAHKPSNGLGDDEWAVHVVTISLQGTSGSSGYGTFIRRVTVQSATVIDVQDELTDVVAPLSSYAIDFDITGSVPTRVLNVKLTVSDVTPSYVALVSVDSTYF